ncbi:helix-turn-helix transcriptional regulator [Halalkalicoccus tibetensis]|uniref:Helix-turn-helix transcriptional regulator n=1 Tax=Halalkalicoccus tibetensis TaxID=175632 RepID=A0ABD5UZ01_9EURY
MNWILEPVEGASPADALQTTSVGGWIVALGLGVLLAGSGAVAWQRRTEETTSPPSPDHDVPDEPMALTDEERVLRLLDSNGGRMRQTAIVETTGWSKSKTSMLLSEMESEGSISKLRVGRENLISRPGSEPEAMRSPLETGT